MLVRNLLKIMKNDYDLKICNTRLNLQIQFIVETVNDEMFLQLSKRSEPMLASATDCCDSSTFAAE